MKKAAATIQDRIAHVDEIKERISAVRREIGSISQNLGPIAGDARSRLESFIYRHGAGVERRIESPSKQQELRTLKEASETACNAAMDAYKKKELLERGLADLQEELDNFTYVARVEEVIKHQAAVSEAAQVLVSLKGLIAEQQSIVEANTGLTVGDLYKQRQDLLADSAMGKDVVKEIEKLDGEIESKEKELTTADKTRTDAEHAIVGLRRKLADAEQTTTRLETENPQILLHFFKGEAELVGGDYAKKAGELSELHQRLLALNALIKVYSGNNEHVSIMTAQAHNLQIPAFRVATHNIQQDSVHAMLFSAKVAPVNITSLIEAEKAKVKGYGIKI